MGLFLYILSRLIGFIFITVALVYSIVKSVYRRKFFVEGLSDINNKLISMAVAFDMYGNVVGNEILNDMLVKDKTIHPFGKKGETISQGLGWNKYYENLTKTGKLLDKILDLFDRNHSLKSIEK